MSSYYSNSYTAATSHIRALPVPESVPTARYGNYNAPVRKTQYPPSQVAAAPVAASRRPSSGASVRYSAAATASTTSAAPSTTSNFMTQVTRSVPKPQLTLSRRNAVDPKASPRLPVLSAVRGKPLLVLDLDETLVHASVDPVPHDVAFRVPMESQCVMVYVKLRPGVYEFLSNVAKMFEVCVFTASLSQYADQVIDYLDPRGQLVHHRLFREHCTNVDGSYVKDLALLGRNLDTICIIDNSPIAYSFHPENALSIISWFDDMRDRELSRLMPVLHEFASTGNVYAVTKHSNLELL